MKLRIYKNRLKLPVLLTLLTILFNDNALLVATSLNNMQYAYSSLIIYIIVYLYITLKGKRNREIGKCISYMLLCCSLILLTSIISFDFSIQHFLVIFLLFQAFVVVRTMRHEEYIDNYVVIMGLLALISIVMQTLTTAVPSILSLARKSYNSNNILFYNFFLYFRSTNEAFRNYGIFTEPGDHQHYLNTALLLYLFVVRTDRIKQKKWIPVVLTIASITTFSPAGVVFVGCIWTAYLFANTKNIKRTASLVFGGIGLLAIILSNERISGGIRYSILKLTGQVSTSQGGRLAGIQAGIEAFLKNPFLGLGFQKGSSIMAAFMASKGDVASQTSTITGFLGFFGLAFALLVIIPFFRAFIPRRINLMSKLFLFIGIMISINNERYVWELTYYIFALYGVVILSQKTEEAWKDDMSLFSIR